jgi:YHS domain-containing protein
VAQDLSGIKCVVNGDRNASSSAAVDYRDSSVYTCCPTCAAKLKSDPASFATRANHQLVLTGQFKQTACPISGSGIDPDVTANVGGTKVLFCCGKCLKKVTDTPEMSDRAELVFGDEAFERSFTRSQPEIDLSHARCPINPDKQVSAEASANHLQGKVFFCCKKCAAAFTDDPSEQAISANRQLVLTGQYVQTACPFSGGEANQDHSMEVAQIKIGLCCDGCVTKLNAAKTPQAMAELVFAPDVFAKSFKPANEVTQPETTE